MDNRLWFNNEQLFWLEELDPSYFIELQIQPRGVGVFNDSSSEARQSVALQQIPSIKEFNVDNNIWRSWTVYRDKELTQRVGPVPLILDIDDESEPADLMKAYSLTYSCLNAIGTENSLVRHVKESRIVFSGKKGFHIEIKPSMPIDAHIFRQQLLDVLHQHIPYSNYNIFYGNTVLDTLSHKWVRLSNTVYSWRMRDGSIYSRKSVVLHVSDFKAMKVEDILKLAQVD